MPQRLRIFVSSPGDVEKERLRAGLVIDKLAQDYGRFFSVEGYLWEHEPMLSSAHFQDAIEPPSAFDIVILILWSRLGTPLPEHTSVRDYRGLDGRAPVTGTEWEYEDALRSAQSKGIPDLMVFRNVEHAPVDTRNAEARAASIAQLTALDTFWKLHFADHGTFRYAYEEYDTLERFAGRLEETLRKVIERRVAAQAGGVDRRSEPIWLGEPFRGLESYEFEHAPIYFGRDAQITKAMEQLAANATAGAAFLLVSGASGSGKSSLVKAAMVPRLMKPQRITGAAFLRRVVFRAGAAGADPFLGLAQALTGPGEDGMGLPELLGPGQNATQFAGHLRGSIDNPGYVFGAALGRLTETGRNSGDLLSYETARLILVVDQFEELFTVPGVTDDARRQFAALLAGLARSGHVWVIVTLRADFWHRAAELPALIALAAGHGRIDIAAPAPAEQAEIIRKPAMAAGLAFEAHPDTGLGLDAVLSQDAAAAPGVLPLLSFTLDELYRDARLREASVLTHSSYEALGGLEGAIAKRADDTVGKLSASAQAALPRVLRALATVSTANDHVPVSRSAPLTTFADGSPARQLVDALVAARLLVADDGAAVPTVRLAHEALIGRWQRAKDQLAADRRDLETRSIVEEHFKRWREATGRARRLLLMRNPDLAAAADLARRWGDELDAPTRDYIQRSGRRARLSQTLTAAAALVFALVAIAAVVEEVAATRAKSAADTAQAEAVRQRQRAEKTLDAAFEAATQMNAGDQATSRKDYAVALKAYRAGLAIVLGMMEPDSVGWQIQAAAYNLKLGDTLRAQGKLTEALAAYRESVAVEQRLALADPHDITRQRGVAIANQSVGDIQLNLGSLNEALTSYRTGLTATQQVAQADPTDAVAQRDLSIMLEKIGDVYADRGQLADSLTYYNQDLAIAQSLVARNPRNLQAQRDLGISQNRVGDVLRSEGRTADALAAYRIGLDISQRLANADKDNAEAQLDLSISFDRVGNILFRQGQGPEALKLFQQSLDVRVRLAQAEPSNVQWQRNLSVSYGKVGDVYMLQPDVAKALDAYSHELAISQKLTNFDPQNSEWQRDLALTFMRIGLANRYQGDDQTALKSFTQGQAIMGRLVKAVPDNPIWKGDLHRFDDEIAQITKSAVPTSSTAPKK